MSTVPTFFFSHARQDRVTAGRYLNHFFSELVARLASRAGVVIEGTHIGTIDARTEQGNDWDDYLCQGLRADKVFVAILSPLYFKRPNCGKELAAFLLRSPDLGIDENGALTGARNVVPIRWYPENWYAANTEKDSLIPVILRRIEDTPADDQTDAERTRAIERYRKKGMENCVAKPYFRELIDLFVTRIFKMPELPEGPKPSFATAQDAFTFNWAGHFGSASPAATPPSTSAAPAVEPRALASIVAFYVTRRSFTSDPNTVLFADQLIAETLAGGPQSTDQPFAQLLADVRAAGVAEGFTVFHAANNPPVPVSPRSLLDRLASLSRSRVLTALVVEPDVWPGTSASPETTADEEIIRSNDWTGPVLLPDIGTLPTNIDELAEARHLPPRFAVIPQASETRVATLRRVFIDARGRVLRTSTAGTPGAERVPVLKGVSARVV